MYICEHLCNALCMYTHHGNVGYTQNITHSSFTPHYRAVLLQPTCYVLWHLPTISVVASCTSFEGNATLHEDLGTVAELYSLASLLDSSTPIVYIVCSLATHFFTQL